MTDTCEDQSFMKTQLFENVDCIFKMPITYNSKVKKLNNNIICDLELIKTIEDKKVDTNKNNNPIYEDIFKPDNRAAKKIMNQLAENYTTDIEYLKETQILTESFNDVEINTIYNKHNFNNFDMEETISAWEDIKGETGFCEKYLYIDWSFALSLNNNASFLQIMCLYNILSPIISLCLPIIVLIVPFIMIKIQGLKLDLNEYLLILKSLISNHAITKIFTQFHEVDFGNKLYLLLSSAFYLFSIYQNILICVRFYSNIKKIHDYLIKFKKYINFSIETMEYYLHKSDNLNSYKLFNDELHSQLTNMYHIKEDLINLTPFNLSLSKVSQIGHIMYVFYQFYDNSLYNRALLYSFEFNGYFSTLNQLVIHIDNQQINKASYSKKTNTKTTITKMYYPKFINQKRSNTKQNSCDLSKNIIITGPNASGKTTTIKTVLINILLSQQIGFGCFETCKLKPYENIHCYLNIPDTSGRDSLFQAEARRCKEIIDSIEENPEEGHFCIFDELYSGTNPDEAVSSANAFMDFIIKNDNVTCLLTTHYFKLCKKLSKNKKILNFHMKTIKTNDNFEYTYQLKKGISKIKGGIKVLKDMNYPQEIIENT